VAPPPRVAWVSVDRFGKMGKTHTLDLEKKPGKKWEKHPYKL